VSVISSTSTSPTASRAHRARWYAPRLDTIRFVAFALVFLGHNLGRASFIPLAVRSETGPGEILGVIMFFVLSAYLIGRLLLIERSGTGTISLRRYWPRRILRIWPLYFTLVALVYVMAPVLRSAGHPLFLPAPSQLPYWVLFVDNWAAPIKSLPTSYLSMFWTVCLEEQVYFLFPLILLLPRRPMLVALAGLVVAGPVACYATVRTAQPYPAVWNFTTSHLDSFGLGLLLAVAAAGHGFNRTWERIQNAIESRSGVVALIVLTLGYLVCGAVVGPGFYEGYPTVCTYLAASLLSAGWVIVASSQRPLERMAARVGAWLGRRGYGLYAWHWPVLLALTQVSPLTRLGNLTVLGFAASLGLTLLLAIVSYRFLEVPFLRLRLRFQVVQNRL
jgi:peptidoglycan/LPS O-acetylase OafA/YrhL